MAGINRLYSIDLRGKPGPFFRDVTVVFSQDGQLVGYDGWGKERFRIALNDGHQAVTLNNPLNTYGLVQGHILVVSTGTQILAMDTLKNGASQILWRKELVDSQGGVVFFPQQMGVQQFGNRRAITQANAQPIGTLGPCTDYAVYYQRGRDVYAIDPMSGGTLWVRHGIEPGSDLFGDEEVLVIAPPGRERREPGANGANLVPATVLRATDGQFMSEAPVPLPDQRWTTFGRRLLITRGLNDGSQLLVMLDPLSKREIWSMNVASGMKGAVVDGESIAVMQPDGKFSLVSLTDGTKQIEEQLEPDRNLQNIYYMRSADCDILITNHPPALLKTGAAYVQYPDISRPEINGSLYAFDRAHGKRMWPAPVRVAGQCLAVDVPSELPVLVFTRTLMPTNNGSRAGSPRGVILCIDKRNGRLIYEDDGLAQGANVVDAFGDLTEKTVGVQMQGQALTFKFTSNPVPPEPPYQSDAFEKQGDPKGNGFLRELGGFIAPAFRGIQPK